MATAEEILRYWFGDLSGATDWDASKAKLWWAGGPEVDREIRERFGDDWQRAKSGEFDAWLLAPRSALALIILLDQFSRNLGRGTPEAFAADAAALAACRQAIRAGHDRALRPIERAFLYMPLMHAEDREAAHECVARFEALSREISDTCPAAHPDFLEHAREHANTVQRFGRYPHRNAILGRGSTAEEQVFLSGGGPDYGQTKT